MGKEPFWLSRRKKERSDLTRPILTRLGFSFCDLFDTFPEGERDVFGELSNDSCLHESFETSVKFKGPTGENDIVKI